MSTDVTLSVTLEHPAQQLLPATGPARDLTRPFMGGQLGCADYVTGFREVILNKKVRV